MTRELRILRTLIRRKPFPLDRVLPVFSHIFHKLLADDLHDAYATGAPVDVAAMIDRLTGWPGFGAAYVRVLDSTCPLCDGPGPATRCPRCSIGRCAACMAKHDNHSLCFLTAEAADTHRLIRGGTDLDASDFAFARRVMASSYIRRSQH